MGRPKLESRKINKSGRFDPELLDKINDAAEKLNLNFSQTLEFLSNIGVHATSSKVYDKIKEQAVSEQISYAQKVEKLLKDSLNF